MFASSRGKALTFESQDKLLLTFDLQDDGDALHVQDSRYGAKNQWIYNTKAHPFRVVGKLAWPWK